MLMSRRLRGRKGRARMRTIMSRRVPWARPPAAVGRLRYDNSLGSAEEGYTGIEMFIAGDQLLKGAAQNAVQIAELLLE